MVPDGIGDWIHRRTVKSRGHTAVVFRDEELSYEQLAARIDRLAAALRERAISRGDRVAYLGNNHPSFIEALFATTLLGAVFVPLNTRLSVPELEFQLSDAGVELLISSSALEASAAGASASLPVRRLVVQEDDSRVESLPEEAEDYEHALVSAPALGEVPRVTLEDRAVIIYTSGTTGRPKGAVLTHGNLTWNSFNALIDYDVQGHGERALMISPLFHVAAFSMGLLPTLLKGGTVLLQERFVPAEALAAIQRYRATYISGVPTTYQLMMEDPAWATTDISSLERMTCGGSPVPLKVLEAYGERGLKFSGGYGMTESSPGITALPARYGMEKLGSSGLAHFFTKYRIRDTDTGEIVTEPGARGEIEASGPNIFLEYWGRPDATAEAFTADGWLRTGDVGYSDADGFITIADRVKDMIISGGENVYSAEVEIVISQLPGVTGVAVIGVPHDRWGEVPHAIVTLAPGASLDVETLIEHCSARLARYKVPKTLEIVDELPRTASGKVQKALLRHED
ncbi:MAG TPA: long-chain fatty acid--CoA ligase [Microbacteriaceae bacterium]|nr:long-chain fatty acid--CoA ligase [Microbacteriaceae bacterium]